MLTGAIEQAAAKAEEPPSETPRSEPATSAQIDTVPDSLIFEPDRNRDFNVKIMANPLARTVKSVFFPGDLDKFVAFRPDPAAPSPPTIVGNILEVFNI